jgi:hypothetical protein
VRLDAHFDAGRLQLFGAPTVEGLAQAHPDVAAELGKFDSIQTAATFGGLLALPELQSNCFRIEALVHLAIAYCAGHTTPTWALVQRSFERLDKGHCGLAEDPAEDVFAGIVGTRRGNFRVFEGIREGTCFYLQRVLDVVENMPDGEPFNRIRDSIGCMLKLSDAVAARARVSENSLGQEMPLHRLPSGIANRLAAVRRFVRFSEEDLAQLQIPIDLLSDFAFGPSCGTGLRHSALGHSELERRPLVLQNRSLYLLLPTAVASAITRFVIEEVVSMNSPAAWDRSLAREYQRLVHETPILGGHNSPRLIFQKMSSGQVGSVMTEVDPGRFLLLIFFVDGLSGFDDHGGLGGANSNPDELSDAVAELLRQAAAEAQRRNTFRDGIALVVSCGYGRGLVFGLEDAPPEHWRLESIAAHDLVTLSWLSDFDRLCLWRLLDLREAVEREGVELMNVNGLLNLVAWSRLLGGDIVPHGRLPDSFSAPTAGRLLMIPAECSMWFETRGDAGMGSQACP